VPRKELRCDVSSAVNAASLISRIKRNVLRDLSSMSEALGESASKPEFDCLAHSAIASLSHIGQHIMEGRSMPGVHVKCRPGGAPPRPHHREVRLGVFPTAADPIHWAHLLGGLFAIETFELDKVIFVVAGSDHRKPDMTPAETRHAMARALLKLFSPLFECSSIALGGSSSGEENLFKILGMNPGRHIHAYYIAGSDHYHRYQPATGNPDTLQKLEDGITRSANGFDDRFHRVSAVFLEREPGAERIPSSLDVHWVRGLPAQTSSTGIRRAFEERDQRQKLCSLPFAAYLSIFENRLYRASPCEGVSPPSFDRA
jgi:nicotinic acid mononucleotide adenylyltransferase